MQIVQTPLKQFGGARLSPEQMMAIPAEEICDSARLCASPAISVLMVTYNHGKYIGQAIESIVTQDINIPFELVIGEDCSTDNTMEVCKAYQAKYPDKVRIVTSTRNVGMQSNCLRIYPRVRGRYVAVCDGDDYWCDPQKLKLQYNLMEADPRISMCFSSATILYEDSQRPAARWEPRRKQKFYDIHDFASMRVAAPTASLFLRWQFANGVPEWFAHSGVLDFPIILLHLLTGPASYIDRPLCVYRLHATGVWRSAEKGVRRKAFADMLEKLHNECGALVDHDMSILAARGRLLDLEDRAVTSGVFGLLPLVRGLRSMRCNPLLGGRTFFIVAFHLLFPGLYLRLVKAGILNRMSVA